MTIVVRPLPGEGASATQVTRRQKKGACFDCKKYPPTSYMVYDAVWVQAWPDYDAIRKQAIRRHRVPPYLTLCLECLSQRLGRPLIVSDFDLSLPINQGIVLGLQLSRYLLDPDTSTLLFLPYLDETVVFGVQQGLQRSEKTGLL